MSRSSKWFPQFFRLLCCMNLSPLLTESWRRKVEKSRERNFLLGLIQWGKLPSTFSTQLNRSSSSKSASLIQISWTVSVVKIHGAPHYVFFPQLPITSLWFVISTQSMFFRWRKQIYLTYSERTQPGSTASEKSFYWLAASIPRHLIQLELHIRKDCAQV